MCETGNYVMHVSFSAMKIVNVRRKSH